MSAFFLGVAGLLLVCIVAGLWRVIRGPAKADRVASANLFGTLGVAILLLLSEAGGGPALRDVALVLAVLVAVTIFSFVSRMWKGGRGDEPGA